MGCGIVFLVGVILMIGYNIHDLATGVINGDVATMGGAGALALLGLVCGVFIWAGHGDQTNPRGHAVFKKIASMGPLDQKVAEVETQVRESGQQIGNFVFTPNYLLDVNGIEVFLYTELIWIYKKQTKHSVNFIPTGTTYEVIMNLRDGREKTMSGAAKVVEHILHTLAVGCPWIVAGYSKELDATWTRKRKDFIADVDARRQAYNEIT